MLEIGAGGDRSVLPLASMVAPDCGPCCEVDAVGDAGGDEDRSVGDDERDAEQDAKPEHDRVLLGG